MHPLLAPSLCATGAALYGAAGRNPLESSVEPVRAWQAFGEHAITCATCYRPVARQGGLARVWRDMVRDAEAAPAPDPGER